MAIEIIKANEHVDPDLRVDDLLRLLHGIRGEELPKYSPKIAEDRQWIEHITAEFRQKFGVPKIATAREVLKKMARHATALGNLYIHDSGALLLNFATDKLDDTHQTRDEKWDQFQAMRQELIADGLRLKEKSERFYEMAMAWDDRDTGQVHSVNEMARGSLLKELVSKARAKFVERQGQISGTFRKDFIDFTRLLYQNIVQRPLKANELIRACNDEISREIADKKSASFTD